MPVAAANLRLPKQAIPRIHPIPIAKLIISESAQWRGQHCSDSRCAGASSYAATSTAPVVIPAGKVLTVTLDQTVNSKVANNGDAFAASLAEPVTVDANVVLPAGTKVSGTVVQAQSAGKFNGHALLQLTLDSIRLNGTRYSIQTSEFEDVGKGRGKRTAVGAGGGAAFGLIVGALAGGGKGAAIGALAGGGAGAAGAGFTGKKDIVLPAETRLHFKLAQPVSIAVSQ